MYICIYVYIYIYMDNQAKFDVCIKFKNHSPGWKQRN